LKRTTKYVLFDYTRNKDILKELKTQPLLEKKSKSIKMNGYNMLRGWTDIDARTLLRNNNQHEEENKTPHLGDFTF
jgi:hypothetical protein